MKITKTTFKTGEDADIVASELQRVDVRGWEFRVGEHYYGVGWDISIYDENQKFVCYWLE